MSNQPPGDSAEKIAAHKVRQVEIFISTLLRAGVILSVAVILIGMIATFIHHPEYLHSHADLARLTNPSRAKFPHTLSAMFNGVRHFEGRAIVVAGLLLLIATPVMRVAVSVFAFIYERDLKFVAITATVFALLILAFFLGTAG